MRLVGEASQVFFQHSLGCWARICRVVWVVCERRRRIRVAFGKVVLAVVTAGKVPEDVTAHGNIFGSRETTGFAVPYTYLPFDILVSHLIPGISLLSNTFPWKYTSSRCVPFIYRKRPR